VLDERSASVNLFSSSLSVVVAVVFVVDCMNAKHIFVRGMFVMRRKKSVRGLFCVYLIHNGTRNFLTL
jgi:hypothetical protein